MKSYLLDTNVPSELSRDQPEQRVITYLEGIPQANTFLSVLTLGEIRKGIAGLAPGRRRDELEGWIETHVRRWFAGRILPVTEAIAERWGRISADAKRRGTPLPVIDGIIAATAQDHGLTLVTRNVADFKDIQLDIVNPWDL